MCRCAENVCFGLDVSTVCLSGSMKLISACVRVPGGLVAIVKFMSKSQNRFECT